MSGKLRIGAAGRQIMLLLQDLYRRGCTNVTIFQLIEFAQYLEAVYNKHYNTSADEYEEYEYDVSSDKIYNVDRSIACKIWQCIKAHKSETTVLKRTKGMLLAAVKRLAKQTDAITITDTLRYLKADSAERGRYLFSWVGNHVIQINKKILDYKICEYCTRRLACVCSIGKR